MVRQQQSGMGRRWCVVAAALAAAAGSAQAQTINLRTERVISGLSAPLYLTAPRGDTTRVWVVQQGSAGTALIRVFGITPTGAYTSLGNFGTFTGLVTGGERGLLGLAFHPDYNTNGYFWVNYTRSGDGATVVARGRRNGAFASNTAIATGTGNVQLETVLVVAQPATNHNGGWIDFGPDGNLYISMGDGGNAGDPFGTDGNGQNTSALLGKILRLDVDGPDNIPGNADDDGFPVDANRLYTIPATGNAFPGGVGGAAEIWLWGLRNAWRNAFDRETGELYIADVGQDQREEVTIVPQQIPVGGVARNLGWRCWEGTRRYTSVGICGAQLLSQTRPPIFEYGHTAVFGPTPVLGCSITGGFVYRGCSMPTMRGTYFFSDYCTGDLYSWRANAGRTAVVDVVNRRTQLDPPGTLTIDNVVSFGEDALGEMYIVDATGGEVFRIYPAAFDGPDCNTNGQPDACEIATGAVPDANNNGIPDGCENLCDTLDFNNDGDFPTPLDLEDFIAAVAGNICSTCSSDLDFNNDGDFPTPLDVEAFISVNAGGPCIR